MKKKVNLEDVNRKLDKVLQTQAELLQRERLLKTEENLVEKEEQEELKELKELESFEKVIQEEVGEHPLKKITSKDVVKGSIGAFFGVVYHYTFVYGVEVAAQIDFVRATLLFPIAYAFGGVFMYMTGFRRINDPKTMSFLPVRLTILYLTAIITAVLILILFTPGFFNDFWTAYKQVATVTLSAVIGACTADLVGKD